MSIFQILTVALFLAHPLCTHTYPVVTPPKSVYKSKVLWSLGHFRHLRCCLWAVESMGLGVRHVWIDTSVKWNDCTWVAGQVSGLQQDNVCRRRPARWRHSANHYQICFRSNEEVGPRETQWFGVPFWRLVSARLQPLLNAGLLTPSVTCLVSDTCDSWLLICTSECRCQSYLIKTSSKLWQQPVSLPQSCQGGGFEMTPSWINMLQIRPGTVSLSIYQSLPLCSSLLGTAVFPKDS